MTQEEVAREAQVHVTYVSRIEHGGLNLTWSGLRRISHALGLRPFELARRAEELEEEDRRAR
jgi:transcriptional regulator with XRE-family HTH domain